MQILSRLVALSSAAALAACGDVATLPVSAGTGANPTLPAPHKTLLPTVNVAPAQGWAEGATPVAAAGLSVNAFATGLDHPRGLYVLPNGDVLVAETNAPYATVGSNSNVGENGVAAEEGRAAIWQIDPKTGTHRVFAAGPRNPNDMAWEPGSGALWTVVNERDEIGSDLVPDYLTSVRDGGFYGWPYSHYGAHVDARASPPRPDLATPGPATRCAARARSPARSRSRRSQGTSLPARFASGMFVGQHGSWNRRPHSRSAWRSTRRARCWSPTMSAT